jgi:hypothetical protein
MPGPKRNLSRWVASITRRVTITRQAAHRKRHRVVVASARADRASIASRTGYLVRH